MVVVRNEWRNEKVSNAKRRNEKEVNSGKRINQQGVEDKTARKI